MNFSDLTIDPSWDKKTIEIHQNFYKEIWEDKEYFRHGLRIKKGDIVVDCGANIGIFTLLALEHEAKKIYSFEYDKNFYNLLVKNCKKSKKIITTNGLITHKNINLVGFDKSVETYDLSKIIQKFNLKSIDFLKLDVEGFEFAFVLNEPDDVIQKVNQWAIEIHTCGVVCDRLQEYNYTLAMVDKFAKLGYYCVLEKLHIDTFCYMIYARKMN